MNLYAQLFVECIGHGSIVPFQSDTTFFAMKSFGGYNMRVAMVLAVIGSVIGQSVNWAVGNAISLLKQKSNKPLQGVWFTRLQTWFNRYLFWLLLFSWAPLCNLFTVAAGMFGTRFRWVLLLLLLGQTYHYYSLL